MVLSLENLTPGQNIGPQVNYSVPGANILSPGQNNLSPGQIRLFHGAKPFATAGADSTPVRKIGACAATVNAWVWIYAG